MTNVFDITDFGAVGDGSTDCTSAIQAAIDSAAKVCGAVTVPPGIYLSGTLHMRPSVCLCGFSGWGYRETGGSVIKLCTDDALCLIDMTGAFGARVCDLQLLGGACRGNGTHGIYVHWDERESRLHDDPKREDNALPEACQIGFREDSITVSNVQIKNFSGDAIHLYEIWAFTIKDCMLIANGGHAIYINGWDGWISNCVMHTNHGSGIFTDKICAAVTITANRIEWNRRGGMDLINSSSLNITGNYFDRSYGPAIRLRRGWMPNNNITMTGNIFNRSGKATPAFENDKYENCHLYLEGAHNLSIGSNTFLTGVDDFGEQIYSPDYGIVYRDLRSCAFTGNTLYGGAMKEKIVALDCNSSDIQLFANAGITPHSENESHGNGTY